MGFLGADEHLLTAKSTLLRQTAAAEAQRGFNDGSMARPDYVSVKASNPSESQTSRKLSLKGSIPLKFTSGGTTPSGKPRLHVCDVCTRAFARQEHLRRHQLSHTKEKPFSCSICQRKFSRRDLLLRHSTKLHGGAADVKRVTKRRSNSKNVSFEQQSSNGKSSVLFSSLSADPLSEASTAHSASASVFSGNAKNENVSFKAKGPASISRESSGQLQHTLPPLVEDKVNNTAGGVQIRPAAPQAENRRASFSAMSGVNYSTSNMESHYATEAEFSTPQYYSMLDDLKNVDPVHEPGEEYVDQWLLNQPDQQHQRHQQHNADQSYAGYSFYNDIDVQAYEEIPEILSGTNQSPKPKLLSEQMSKLKVDRRTSYHSMESQIDPKTKNVSQAVQHIKSEFGDIPPISPIGGPPPPATHSQTPKKQNVNSSSPEYWRSMGVNGLLSGLYNSYKTPTNPNTTNVDKSSSSNPNSNDHFETDPFMNDDELDHRVKAWQDTLFNQPISQFERLNDMHVSNTYGIPQGYSFYGEYESSSSQIGPPKNHDSEATISPSLLDSPSLNSTGHMFSEPQVHTRRRSRAPSKFEDEFNEHTFDCLSHVYLFTSKTRIRIDEALEEYPYTGVPSPVIPNDEMLNHYVDQFINKFLNHHPFIHKAALNEYSLITNAIHDIKKTTISIEDAERVRRGQSTSADIEPGVKIIRDETFNVNFRASLVCLPFLVTTIGAIVSNKKDDAASLYEASRRCIHVYLETRRKLQTVEVFPLDDNQSTSSSNTAASLSSSPLWLIQSLALSVIYGLFADEEVSLSVIIRQVEALNTLLKSSGLNSTQYKPKFDHNFNEFIKYESTIRTIHMVFHVSTLLSALYNITPSITVADMLIDLPCSSSIWECYTSEDYTQMIESFDFRSRKFNDALRHLLLLDFNYYSSMHGDGDVEMNSSVANPATFLFEWHISEFGLVCIQNALHQMVYFLKLGNSKIISKAIGFETTLGRTFITNLDQLKIIGNNWSKMVRQCQLFNDASEVFNDSLVLDHYLNLKLNSISNLNKIKESVWLKSYQGVNENYLKFFNFGETELRDITYQQELTNLIGNAIDILKLMFFKHDASLMGSISQKAELKNSTLDQLDNMFNDLNETFNDMDFNVINLNVFHKLSLDSQILFDVMLVIVKFLINFENVYKRRLKFNHYSSFTFLDDDATRISNNHNDDHFHKVLFKFYIKFFKIYLNLEQFMKINYNYEDFETDQPISGNPYSSVDMLRARGLVPAYGNFDYDHHDDLAAEHDNMNEIEKLLAKSKQKYVDSGQWMGDAVKQYAGLSDIELIMNELIGFRLPYKLLKVGGFLYGFIYDKNFKFVNFRHLSDVLFHLRIFLESKVEDDNEI